jgi:hypothetical protein
VFSISTRKEIGEQMTETGVVRRSPLRHGMMLIALFAATLMLSGGARALAPATATAMISDGEECGEPTVDCEPGGGAGGSGGGPGDTVGSETIVIDDTAPSPCVKQPWRCGPSQVGGGPRFGPEKAGSPGPRPARRPTTVAQTVNGRDCGKFALSLEQLNSRLFRVGVVLTGLEVPFQQRVGERLAELERWGKLKNALRGQRPREAGTTLMLEDEIAGSTARIGKMLVEIEKLEELIEPLHKQRANLNGQAYAARRDLKRCMNGGTGGKGGGTSPPQIAPHPEDRLG